MSTLTPAGRPYRRLQAVVFTEESHCWLCQQPVDQTLHYNDPMARSLDHVTPLAKGGDPLARTNARLAHRKCNRDRGDGPPDPAGQQPITTRRW